MFQFYDGNSLFTVLIDDKEIQIDNLSNESKLLIQNFIKDYQNDYDRVITRNNEELTSIQLTPKNYDYMQIYNHCIDSSTPHLPQATKTVELNRFSKTNTARQLHL